MFQIMIPSYRSKSSQVRAMLRRLRSFVLCDVGAILLYAPSCVYAAPVIYTLNFTGGQGGALTPSGEFSYDATMPVGYQFYHFDVYYDSLWFNLVASANGRPGWPWGLGLHVQDSVGVFAGLMSIPPCTGTWTVDYDRTMSTITTYMKLDILDPATGTWFRLLGSAPWSTRYREPAGGGNFTVMAPTPEPGTTSMLLLGALAILLKRRTQTLGPNRPKSEYHQPSTASNRLRPRALLRNLRSFSRSRRQAAGEHGGVEVAGPLRDHD